jgi:classical protein kinase C
MLRLMLRSSLVDQLLAPLQVLHASKLRGADMGGSSDPVCKVSLGPFKARTRVLKHTLDPEWNETFIFVLEPDALAVMGSVPVLSFEVWDHNNFAPNYFLGEVRRHSAY